MMKLDTPTPNTCTRCGQPLGAVCYAESMDAAVAGLAWCEACEAPVKVSDGLDGSAGSDGSEKPRKRRKAG